MPAGLCTPTMWCQLPSRCPLLVASHCTELLVPDHPPREPEGVAADAQQVLIAAAQQLGAARIDLGGSEPDADGEVVGGLEHRRHRGELDQRGGWPYRRPG